MRRRLRLMALAISAVAMAAFLVPLALSLKHQQRTNAIASAGQVATDVAALAGKLGADPLRMRNMYSTLYGGGPYTVTLWYPDGSSVPLTLGQPPTVPEDVRQIQRSRTPALRQVLQRADGVSITVTTPSVFGFPGPDDQQATPVTQVVVPTSELTRGVTAIYLRLGGLALAIMLASIVVADRVALMRPPRVSPALA